MNVHFHPREVKSSTLTRLNSVPWELKLQSQRNSMFPANKQSRLSAKSLRRAMSKSLMQVSKFDRKPARTSKMGADTADQDGGHWATFCRANPALGHSVQDVLDKVLHGGSKANTPGLFVPTASFTLMDLTALAQLLPYCEELLAQEASLVKGQAPCKIFGDIHGQFSDLMNFFSLYGSPSHRNGDINLAQYVFMGDFVDRGMYGLEVITTLLCLKARYPKRILLIRGNHETEALNEVYGFMDECLERLRTGNRRQCLGFFYAFQKVFSQLPLGALIDGKVLCVHGGIGANVKSLEDISSISRPVDDPTEKLTSGADYHTTLTQQERVIVDLLWSDPRDKVKEFGRASVRGAGSYFDTNDVYEFCKRTGVQLIVRAHECVPNGYALWARGRCITLFSAPDYCGRHRNAGAMLELSRSLGIHVKTVQSRSMSGTWANTVDATPPPSDAEVSERGLSDGSSDDDDYESDSASASSSSSSEEVVAFTSGMLEPVAGTTKGTAIHKLNADDTMLVLRSRNAAKYEVGTQTRLGSVFGKDLDRSLVIIQADPAASGKGTKNKVRWFHAPDIANYSHDEELLDGRALVVGLDVKQQFVFWKFNDEGDEGKQSTGPANLNSTAHHQV